MIPYLACKHTHVTYVYILYICSTSVYLQMYAYYTHLIFIYIISLLLYNVYKMSDICMYMYTHAYMHACEQSVTTRRTLSPAVGVPRAWTTPRGRATSPVWCPGNTTRLLPSTPPRQGPCPGGNRTGSGLLRVHVEQEVYVSYVLYAST